MVRRLGGKSALRVVGIEVPAIARKYSSDREAIYPGSHVTLGALGALADVARDA